MRGFICDICGQAKTTEPNCVCLFTREPGLFRPWRESNNSVRHYAMKRNNSVFDICDDCVKRVEGLLVEEAARHDGGQQVLQSSASAEKGDEKRLFVMAIEDHRQAARNTAYAVLQDLGSFARISDKLVYCVRCREEDIWRGARELVQLGIEISWHDMELGDLLEEVVSV